MQPVTKSANGRRPTRGATARLAARRAPNSAAERTELDRSATAPTSTSAPSSRNGELNGATVSTSTRTACRCGAELRADGRCAHGHVQAGNGIATVTGSRSATFWSAHTAPLTALVAAALAEVGHTTTTAPPAALAAAEGLAQAVLVRDAAFARMAEHGGPLTSAGRGRRCLSVWERAQRAVTSNLRALGLARLPAAAAPPSPAPTAEPVRTA